MIVLMYMLYERTRHKRQWLLESCPDGSRDALEVNDINAILVKQDLGKSLILPLQSGLLFPWSE
jgi:hypothetical protein